MRRCFLLVVLALWCHGQDTYQGHVGRWVIVDATAYTPHDVGDSHHWSTQDTHTASMRDWRHHPHGVAVPMGKDARGKRTEPLLVPYGTRMIIPRGYGYLDRLRANDRVFVADDTGGRISILTEQARDGVPVIDLRFQSEQDAIRWAGPTGRRRLMVFIVEGEVPPPPPAPEVKHDWYPLYVSAKSQLDALHSKIAAEQAEAEQQRERRRVIERRWAYGHMALVLLGLTLLLWQLITHRRQRVRVA